MKKAAGSVLLILGMVVSWTVFYTISKVLVDRTGSAVLSGALIRAAALVFLTIQIVSTGKIRLLFRQGKAVPILLLIGVFGFLLDLFANLGYRYGSLSTGTALLKTDVLMVNLASIVIYRKKLRAIDWLATFLMLAGVFLVLEIDFRAFTFRATDLFFLLSAAAVSANAFLIKHLQEKRGVDAEVGGGGRDAARGEGAGRGTRHESAQTAGRCVAGEVGKEGRGLGRRRNRR